MDKVFVVPELIGGNEHKDPVGPYFRLFLHSGDAAIENTNRVDCAAQALGKFLHGQSYTFTLEIADTLKISVDDVWELVGGNDNAVSNSARRENMINWLRKHFPYSEVCPKCHKNCGHFNGFGSCIGGK